MSRLPTLLALALAAALSLPSPTNAEPASTLDAGLTTEAGAPQASASRPAGAPLGLGGPVTARAAIKAAVGAEITAARTDTVEVTRYATLGQAVAATVTKEAKLTASDGAADDQFGYSVSLSGNRALVGAWQTDDGGSNSGSAYVFAFDGATWGQEAKLTAPDGAAGDLFGRSVSLDGDRALVGAPEDDDGAVDSGSAYVFGFNGTTWVTQAKLTASDAGAGDEFGISVSLDGDRALVGAWLDNNGGSSDVGAGYVFAFDGSQPPGQRWTQQAKLTPPAFATDFGMYVGSSVSLDGNRALLGAPGDELIALPGAGSAFLFVSDGATWSLEQKFRANDSGGFFFASFGSSVSLSGDRVLIGSVNEDNAGGFEAGSAFVFAFDASQPPGQRWNQEAKLFASDAAGGDLFGSSVSLDGERAFVGARSNGGGAAYFFTFNGAAWSQEATLTAADASGGDEFGVSVSLDGDRVLVGAWKDDDGGGNSGSAYVFDLGLGAPLVADAGPDQTVIAGQTVALDGSGSVGATTFTWTLNGSPVATTATPSFCAAAPATYTVTLTVSDGAGGSDADDVTVTAQSPSAALIALAGGVSAATALSPPQKAALLMELKKAQRALARGASPAPFLDAFQAQVQGLQGQGVLTAGQAGVLIASVDAVGAAVASPCNAAGAPATASSTAAEGFGLSVYPNPTAGRATVAFTVEAAGPVRLSVHDALGREVAVLVDGALAEGRHEAVLDAAALPAGVYLVRLATADGRAATQRISRVR